VPPAVTSIVPPPPPSASSENLPTSGPAYESPPGYQSFDSLGVKLLCPPGFQPSKKFVGFDCENPAAMIHVAEIAVDSQPMIERLKKGDVGKPAITLLSMEEFMIGPHRALLMNYEQPDAAGTNWQKWSLMFGNDEKTTMLVAAYLPEAAADLSEPIRSTLTGVKLAPTYSQYSTRNSVGPGTGKLKRDRMSRNKEMYFEVDGPERKTGTSPFLLISEVRKRDEAHDKKEFATAVAKTSNGSEGVVVKSIQPIKLSGVEGYEIYADTQEEGTGAPTSMYLVVLLPPGGYLRIRGSVAKERAAEFLPEFKAMAHGWKQSG
jgi:hypothetical protein